MNFLSIIIVFLITITFSFITKASSYSGDWEGNAGFCKFKSNTLSGKFILKLRNNRATLEQISGDKIVKNLYYIGTYNKKRIGLNGHLGHLSAKLDDPNKITLVFEDNNFCKIRLTKNTNSLSFENNNTQSTNLKNNTQNETRIYCKRTNISDYYTTQILEKHGPCPKWTTAATQLEFCEHWVPIYNDHPFCTTLSKKIIDNKQSAKTSSRHLGEEGKKDIYCLGESDNEIESLYPRGPVNVEGKWFANTCMDNEKQISLDEFCYLYYIERGTFGYTECRPLKEKIIARVQEDSKNSKPNKDEEVNTNKDEELYVIGTGTGFFVNDEGYIATNQHVAGVCQSMASYINGETHLFRILSLDEKNDLALLRGEYRNKNYLNINVMGAEFGEDIMAFGYPLAENLSSSVKLTRGIVSSLSGPNNDISLIQIDAAIQPGNSGGPVLNYFGQVVGVASSGLNKIQMLLDEDSPYIPENVNFAVSATTLTSFLKSNQVSIFNKSFDKKSSQDLAKIGMPPTIQLFCLNTISAHKKLKDSEKYNDVLLRKVVNLK